MVEQLSEEVTRKLSISDGQGNRFTVIPGQDVVSISVKYAGGEGEMVALVFGAAIWNTFLARLSGLNLAPVLPRQPPFNQEPSGTLGGLPESLDDFDLPTDKPSKKAKTTASKSKLSKSPSSKKDVKFQRLGAKVKPMTLWSDEEKEQLAQLIAAGRSSKEAAEVLGRPPLSTENKRYQPQIKARIAEIQASNE